VFPFVVEAENVLNHPLTPGTRLLSQFDGEKHLIDERNVPNAPDKSSVAHPCDHRTTVLGHIRYTLSYTRGHHGQYYTQSRNSCSILRQFNQ
jgi:hypothetical protein